MKRNLNQYNHEEIESIANKYLQGEFVYPTGKEMEEWYNYKKVLKWEINDLKGYIKITEEKGIEDSLVLPKVEENLAKLEKELAWIRSIPTFDLDAYCEYFCLSHDSTDAHNQPSILYLMAERVVNGDASESDRQFVRELFEESQYLNNVLKFRKMTLPVSFRKWTYNNRNPTEYCPFVSSMDATELYDMRDHYVYIVKECTNHRWGESYWVSVDSDNELYSLPVIKDFKNYDFEVGRFYKIKCVDEIRFGNNKRKYVMSIEESTEEEYLTKGFRQYATRW